MRRSRSGFELPMLMAVAVVAAGVTVLPAGALERTSQTVTSQFDPEETAAHPGEHTLAMVLAENHSSGARVCASYSHALSRRPNRGRVSVVLRVLRAGRGLLRGDPLLTHEFGGSRVRDGQALVCAVFDLPLEAGDWLELDYEIRGRPAIRGAGGEAALFVGQVTPP